MFNDNALWGLMPRPKSKAKPIEPLAANMEMIARPAAGKTTLLTAINDVCEGSHLPSGLFFGVDDPLKSNEILHTLRRRRDELQSDVGPGTTQHDHALEYCLQEGEETRVKFTTHEVIGQVLSGGLPDSSPAHRQLYERYVQRLADAHALVPMIAVPNGDGDSSSRAQYKDDLRLTNAYLRQALKMRPEGSCCAVVIAVTKIDSLFATEQQARQALTDDVLKAALSPLVSTVATSEKVREAVIIPTSSLGFGRTKQIEAEADYVDRRGPLHQLLGNELCPFNISEMLAWLLLNSLLPQTVVAGEQESVIARVVQKLSDDVQAMSPWMVTIKQRGRS